MRKFPQWRNLKVYQKIGWKSNFDRPREIISENKEIISCSKYKKYWVNNTLVISEQFWYGNFIWSSEYLIKFVFLDLYENSGKNTEIQETTLFLVLNDKQDL